MHAPALSVSGPAQRLQRAIDELVTRECADVAHGYMNASPETIEQRRLVQALVVRLLPARPRARDVKA